MKPTPTSVKNPQGNSILERVHQVIGEMLRTQNLQQQDFDCEDTWPNILASVAFAIRSSVHHTLGATPSQLVFNRDMILPVKYLADWHLIKGRKQARIDKSNSRENKNRVEWDYKIGDSILVGDFDIKRKLDPPRVGPYKIVRVHTNGTVSIQKGVTLVRVNVRRICPYFDKDLEK